MKSEKNDKFTKKTKILYNLNLLKRIVNLRVDLNKKIEESEEK